MRTVYVLRSELTAGHVLAANGAVVQRVAVRDGLVAVVTTSGVLSPAPDAPIQVWRTRGATH